MLHWKGGVKVNNKDLRSNRIRYAIDECLSGVDKLPTLQYKILQKTRGDVKVRKKLSAGLCLTIILVLAAMGAVAAALLSARDIVEKQAIPMASQSAGDTYSVEETRELLVLAEENGITLSDEAKESISRYLKHDKGYYKEEMIMALAKAEFGDDPTTWSLEEQKWFDDVCVAIGFVDEPQKALPLSDEISENRAIEIAEEYIYAHYEQPIALDDSSVYQRGIQYVNGYADGVYPSNYWTVIYEPKTVSDAAYYVYIDSNGQVLNINIRPSYKEGDQINPIYDVFRRIYGNNFGGWETFELQAFQKAVQSSSSINDPAVLCIKQMDYPIVSENAISAEDAKNIAAKALSLDEYTFKGAVYIGDTPNPVWKVRLYTELTEGDSIFDGYSGSATYYIEIDSVTREVKNVYQRNNHYDHWYLDIVLQRVVDEVDKTWTDKTLGVG